MGSIYSFRIKQLSAIYGSVWQHAKPIMQAVLSLHTVVDAAAAAAAAASCWCCQCYAKGTLTMTLPQ